MFTLLRWTCTIVGLIVLILFGAFKTQSLWLHQALSSWIESDSGYRFSCEKVQIANQWPMQIDAEAVELRYPTNEGGYLCFSAPSVQLEIDGTPFRSRAIQIRKATIALDSFHIIKIKKQKTETRKQSQKSETPERPGLEFNLQAIEVSLERLVVHPSEAAEVAPEVYVLNMKSAAKGPFTSAKQIRDALIPPFLKMRMGQN